MSRVSRIKYVDNPSKLKTLILEGLIDKDNKCKISDREFLRTKSGEITVDGKQIFTGIWTYWTKHPSIINSEPMKGFRIDESTVFNYGILMGYWTEDEVPYDVFTNNTTKIKNKLDEHVLMRMICEEFNYKAKFDVFNLNVIRETLICIHGEDDFNEVKKEQEKIMLER